MWARVGNFTQPAQKLPETFENAQNVVNFYKTSWEARNLRQNLLFIDDFYAAPKKS